MQGNTMKKNNSEYGQIKRRKMRFWAFLLAVLVLITSMSPAVVMATNGTISMKEEPGAEVQLYNNIELVGGDTLTLDFSGSTYDPAVKVMYFSDDYTVDPDDEENYTPEQLLFDTSVAKVAGGTNTHTVKAYDDFKNKTGKSSEDIHFAHWKAYTVKASGGVSRVYLLPQEARKAFMTYHNVDGATNPNADILYEGYDSTLEPAEKAGYDFEGWYEDGELTQYIPDVQDDWFGVYTDANNRKDLYAKWTIKSYDVTFDPDGGSAVAGQKVEYNTKATKPADPTKEGYTFKGWFLNDQKYDFNTPVIANITLKAKWEENKEEGGGEEGGGGQEEGGGQEGGGQEEGGKGSGSGTVSGDYIPFDTTGKLLQVVVTRRTDSSISISWNKITGADGYLVYGHKCFSHNVSFIKDITDINELTYTQDNLEKDSYYKYLIKAYKKKGKRKKIITKSVRVHATTTSDKYTVAEKVEIQSVKGGELTTASGNSIITLQKGKAATIVSKEILEEPNKTIEEHHRSGSKKVTWLSNDPAVAKVSKAGKVKAVGPGECMIYGTAQNGRFLPVKVIVK